MARTGHRKSVASEVSKSKTSRAYPFAAEYVRETLKKTIKHQPVGERTVREAAPKYGNQAPKKSKPKEKKISIAGVFKAEDKNSAREKKRRRGEPKPEPDIMDDIRGDFYFVSSSSGAFLTIRRWI